MDVKLGVRMKARDIPGLPEDAIIVENYGDSMAPDEIRHGIQIMRRVEDITFAISTHSAIVINEFKGFESEVYVLSNGVPTPLDEARNPDWLAHFALGDLYERGDF